jgi:two-component system response regulator AtoC
MTSFSATVWAGGSPILPPGSTMPPSAFQLLVFSGEETRTFDLPSTGDVTLGRDEGSTVRIDDPSVSRHHAILRLGARLEIEDLGGANGIFICDKPGSRGAGETLNVRQLIRRKAELAIGDRILFGTASAVVRRAPAVELPDLAGLADAGVVLRDPFMAVIHEQAARAARGRISVLLLGETGVGKEVLARAIHAYSGRAKGPFLGVNCAALSESLLQSELFGHEKGAFTGAASARPGLFEAADGGTVFLDEIGEMPLGTQAALLRVLEEREVTRLGANRARPVDVRFVAASNRDLEAASQDGRFRPDLYFRLAGMSLTIPPLRERPREIEALVKTFVEAACRQLDRAAPLGVAPAALDLLRAHAWPGNVRELRNAIERAAVLCPGDTILPEHLPPSLLRPPVTAPVGRNPAPAPLGPPLEPPSEPPHLHAEIKSLERARIVDALARCGGNQSQAAVLLGMPRRTLVTRLEEFGLPRPRKRP